MEKFKFLTKNKIAKLPKNPGVYAFKKGAKLLYIGKASNIQDRVKNHFAQPAYRDNLFLNQIQKIGYLKTNSEIEALILEANLIKKCQPRYNVVWRDDKNYFFIAVTKEDFPRIFWTHQIRTMNYERGTMKKGRFSVPRSAFKVLYIGPFVDGKALKQTLKILRKIFPYRSCRIFPKRPCLWYQLGRCPAPCLLKSNLATKIPSTFLKMERECQENVKNLVRILQGKKKQVLRDLKKEMKKASVSQDFERAAKIRDQIKALEKVLSHAKVFQDYVKPRSSPLFYVWEKVEGDLKKILKTKRKISRIEAYDVSNIQGNLATGAMVAFINGQPVKDFYRKFKIKYVNSARSDIASRNANEHIRIRKPDDIAMIKEVLSRRLKHREWPYPDLILIDGGKAHLSAAQLTINNQKLTIPVISLAKKKNELYIENQKRPILLKKLPREIFNLILQLRDEAHRFAIDYHRKLRKIDLIPKF